MFDLLKYLFRKIVFICIAPALLYAGGLTYYGAGGYTFIPDGFVSSDWKYSGSIGGGEYSGLKNIRLYPKHVAFRGSFLSDNLELSLSSTYSFTDKNGKYELNRVYGLLPVIPAVKWSLAKQQQGPVHWGYSVGAMAPYGIYFATTGQLRTPILQPELTAVATIFTQRFYGLAGAALRVADFSGNPMPLAITFETGRAGSTEQLGETEEAFIACGTEMNLGRNLTLQGNYRVELNQDKQGRWGLRLEYHFNGIKSSQEGK